MTNYQDLIENRCPFCGGWWIHCPCADTDDGAEPDACLHDSVGEAVTDPDRAGRTETYLVCEDCGAVLDDAGQEVTP